MIRNVWHRLMGPPHTETALVVTLRDGLHPEETLRTSLSEADLRDLAARFMPYMALPALALYLRDVYGAEHSKGPAGLTLTVRPPCVPRGEGATP